MAIAIQTPNPISAAVAARCTTTESSSPNASQTATYAIVPPGVTLDPADTMWVLRTPVCLDALCSDSVMVFTAHWYGSGPSDWAKSTAYETQAQQTIDAMRSGAEVIYQATFSRDGWRGRVRISAV